MQRLSSEVSSGTETLEPTAQGMANGHAHSAVPRICMTCISSIRCHLGTSLFANRVLHCKRDKHQAPQSTQTGCLERKGAHL